MLVASIRWPLLGILTVVFFCACSGQPRVASEVGAPADWSRTTGPTENVSLNWLSETAVLDEIVREALGANFELARQRQLLEESRLAVSVAGADRWPSLSAGLGASRRGGDDTVQASRGNASDYDLNANLAFELDVWGRLSDAQRAARLEYEADLASYEAARRALVSQTVSLSYAAVTASQLLELFQRRLRSLEFTFDIVNDSYQRGLADALDVYLAQNALEQQRETVAAQEQSVLESVSNLQLVLGRYPDGKMALPGMLPLERTPIPVGLPSELLTRRQDVAAAWLTLLAADARVAIAHKNRFPRLNLTGSAGSASEDLGDVIDAGFSNWSLATNLTQSIFQGGRLRAAKQQAEARAAAFEQSYLALIYEAFREVENAISGNASLNERYAALQRAEQAAVAAQELSLQQYRRGLVTFTTVLEADRRAFDTGSALVRIRNELAQNRIDLYRSLGGEFVLDDES